MQSYNHAERMRASIIGERFMRRYAERVAEENRRQFDVDVIASEQTEATEEPVRAGKDRLKDPYRGVNMPVDRSINQDESADMP